MHNNSKASFNGGPRTAIEAERLTVSLGGNPVLHELTIDVSRGEVLGILGPSGSGKTTLLRALAGLVPLQGGKIRIAGTDQEHVPSWLRDIGFVFQRTDALFPHLSVFENVAFPFRRGGKQLQSLRWNEAVKEMLDLIGMTSFADRSLASLSGGQLQRVAFARALGYRPSIVLLDEPLSSLDNPLRHSLLELLTGLKERFGGTYIYVTHDEREVRYLADRVAILINGRIAQIGSIAEVWGGPDSPEVAQLIGDWNIITIDEGVGECLGAPGQKPPGWEGKTIGVPASRTLFVENKTQVPPGHIALDARVLRRTYTQLGTELHCITKRGDRLVAVASDDNLSDTGWGAVIFEKECVHVFGP